MSCAKSQPHIVAGKLSGTVTLLDMLKRYAFSFYEVIVRLEKPRNTARLIGSYTSEMKKLEREDLYASLMDMRKECETLTLGDTVDQIDFIASEVLRKGNEYSYADVLKDLDHLSRSFSRGLRQRIFFRIQNKNGKYFQNDDLLGAKVNAAFPSSITDSRDAGNCYALEQYEATAFHSMRILERGLGSLAKKFGVDFSHTNWHNVIEEVEKKIRKMDSSFGADWKEQQKFCSQAATHFMFLKEGWRNHVMHVRDVPYDEGRALSVFGHVREFIQALADGGLTE
jgi:hypothetical protein